MTYYGIYNYDLAEVSKGRKNEKTTTYVDDGTTMTIDNSFIETHETVTDTHSRSGGIKEWCTAKNSDLEVDKSRHMDCAPPQSKHKPIPLTIDGVTLQPVSTQRVLGVIIDQHLTWKPQIQRAISIAKAGAAQLRRLARPSFGISPSKMRRLYTSTILTKSLYGADVWLTPIHRNQTSGGRTRQSGSVGPIKALSQAQRIAALTIAGGLRSTPTDSLEAHLDLFPMQLTVDKICHRAAVRLASLPPQHPLAKITLRCSKKYVKQHRSPIHKLMHIYDIHPEEIETIQPVQRAPWLTNQITTCIEPREQAIAYDAAHRDSLRIYTDGSGYEGGAGAAAVLYDSTGRKDTLMFHLGPSSKHTVHEAEVVGLVLAAHMLRNQLGR
jgi:hypothetical protein